MICFFDREIHFFKLGIQGEEQNPHSDEIFVPSQVRQFDQGNIQASHDVWIVVSRHAIVFSAKDFISVVSFKKMQYIVNLRDWHYKNHMDSHMMHWATNVNDKIYCDKC